MDGLVQDLLSYLRNPGSHGANDNRLFARLVAEKPALRIGPLWVFSGHESVTKLAGDARCVMRLPDEWNATRGIQPEVAALTERLLPVQPPTDHKRLRRLLTGEFSARAMVRLRERVAQIVAELFDAAVARGECDFIADICVPLPVFTTAAMLGIPERDRDYVLTWARRLNGSIINEVTALTGASVPASSANGLVEIIGYIEELVRERRRNPGPDLVSRLSVRADSADGSLEHDELVALVAMLFMTGIDTVGSELANVVQSLHDHPEVWDRVVAEPALARNAFAEGTRLHPALPAASRITSADIPLGGTVIPTGATVLLMYGAANLDPTVFPDPLRFDLDRSQASSLGFGHGVHYCLGASLAMMQGELVLRALADRSPNFRIAGGQSRRRTELAFHGLAELRLVLTEPTLV